MGCVAGEHRAGSGPLADVIAVKELSEIGREFERRELKRITDRARVSFVPLGGNRQQRTWVYSETVGDAGLVHKVLPDFWKPALSRATAILPWSIWVF